MCCDFLQSEGFNAYPFHAGLDALAVKIDTQDKFMTEDNVVVCATIAGMGIDKADSGYVAHISLPSSMSFLSRNWWKWAAVVLRG